jgi:response regulator of citrate/malate metabolism
VDEHASNFDAALEAIHRAGLATRTVVVTAATDVDHMTRLLRSGIRDVKLKPYNPAEIPELWEK